MKHYGDITKINGSEIEPVNVIIGGSPCQDLSVAGTQKGLAGERSGLFMEQIRVIKEMRAKYGRPRYMVWENVPGALSSNKGADFGAVLTECAHITDEKAPAVPMPKNGWPSAGCICGVGGKWSVAWRIFDAQFWGTPQRRRRIALAADFGGMCAPEILFERESVSRDFEPGGAPKQDFTRRTESGIDTAGKRTAYCIQGNCIDRALTAGCNGRGWTEDKSYTLNTVDRPAVLALENHPQDSRIKINENGVIQGLNAQMGTGGNNTPMVLSLDRAAYNQGINAKYDIGIDDSGKAYTVVAKGPGAVYCIGNGQADQLRLHDSVGALDCMHDQKAIITHGAIRRITPLECERLQGFPDGWTDTGEWTDSGGRVHKTTDSARYKALGNSIAIPSWFYVLRKLMICCGADLTMGSLFDGIGGFPLIWQSLGGVPVWASEIEEFCIAVTKLRIGVD